MVHDFAIIGGGVAGASLAHFLNKKNANICIIDAGSKLGGVVSSNRIDACLCETAAQSFQGNDSVSELISDLGLEAISPKAEFSRKYIETSGKLFPAPSGPGSFISSDLLSVSAKFRALFEPFIKKSNLEDESVCDFISRRFGAEFSKQLFTPLVNGIWAGDSSKLSMRSSFPAIWEMENEYGSIIKAGFAKGKAKKVLGFKNGTQTFLNAIAKELGNERVILNTKVEKLKLSDGFVEINSELKAKQVILATDASASADLIKFIDLDLANNISKVKYSPLGLIHLVAKQNSNFGAGFLSVGKRATLGVLCSSNAFEGRAPEDSLLLTCFVGGAKNPELADVRDSKIEELVIREVVETLKLESSPQIINKVFWKNAIPNYELGHFKLQEMVECYNQSDNRVKLFGSWLNGAGIGKIIENARRFSSSLKCLN